jgi:hypothetical protein
MLLDWNELNQINAAHKLFLYSFKIHFNIITRVRLSFPSYILSSVFATKILKALSILSFVLHNCPSHSFLFEFLTLFW